MMLPSFIPTGEEFYATIRRGRDEEVLEDAAGVKPRFPSAAAAVRHAKNAIARIEAAARPVPVETQAEIDARVHRQWKVDRAEHLRKEREMFDMRNVQVVTRKRRFPR